MDTEVLDEAVDAMINGNPANENKDDIKLMKCPCCGQMTLKPPIKVGEDIMDHFMACLLTGTPYQYTYALYGGRLKITVEQVTPDSRHEVLESYAILSMLSDKVAGLASQIGDVKSSITTYACIRDIDIEVNGEHNIYHPSDAVTQAYQSLEKIKFGVADGSLAEDAVRSTMDSVAALFKNKSLVSAVPDEIVAALFQLHSEIYRVLMDAGFDENFWARIKLG